MAAHRAVAAVTLDDFHVAVAGVVVWRQRTHMDASVALKLENCFSDGRSLPAAEARGDDVGDLATWPLLVWIDDHVT